MRMTFKCLCCIVCVGFGDTYLTKFNLLQFLNNGILVCGVQNMLPISDVFM